jgi:hypothetical protein
MTSNKAQKTAIRQRMAETGAPYSVARHAVEGEQVPAAVREPPGTTLKVTPRILSEFLNRLIRLVLPYWGALG